MENLGNAFYDIGCHVADSLDFLVAKGAMDITLAYWMFEHCNSFAGSTW